MQKPRFRTVDKSAWLFLTTQLHPLQKKKLSKRTATRCGFLSTASAALNVAESSLPTPFVGESMARYIDRMKAAKAG
jgi:hypothetical protein